MAIFSIIIISFFFGLSYKHFFEKEKEWQLLNALPKWHTRDPDHCNKMSDLRETVLVSMVNLLNQSQQLKRGEKESILFLDIGLSRALGEENCLPSSIFNQLPQIITNNNMLEARIVEHQLELAEKSSNSTPYIIEKIGNSAFNKKRQGSETFTKHDIRPFARTVLAKFGKDALLFSDEAFNQISSDSALGTGAAQVAAAVGHPEALQKINKMMISELRKIPNDQAIPWHTRNRLYELAYAIYFSKTKDEKYINTIRELMTRQVQSWAPPFGLIEMYPKRMCKLLAKIQGSNLNSVSEYHYCGDDKIPFEQ